MEKFASETAQNVSGAAANTRMIRYRTNSGAVRERTVETLLAWARSMGIITPGYIRLVPFGPNDGLHGFPVKNGRDPVDAKYFEVKGVRENEFIFWDEPRNPYRSVLNRLFGAVVVNIAHDVMQNDERFLHILAHEVFEITELKKLFDDSGGRLTAFRFFNLTEPLPTVKNLHWDAWEYADTFVEKLRGGRI